MFRMKKNYTFAPAKNENKLYNIFINIKKLKFYEKKS